VSKRDIQRTCPEQDFQSQIHAETLRPTPSACQSACHIQAQRRQGGQLDCRDISADDIAEVPLPSICSDISLTAPRSTNNDISVHSLLTANHLYPSSNFNTLDMALLTDNAQTTITTDLSMIIGIGLKFHHCFLIFTFIGFILSLFFYPTNATLLPYAFCQILNLLCVSFLFGDRYLGNGDTDWREFLHDGRAIVQTGPLPDKCVTEQ